MLMNRWISRRWIARNWPPAKTIRYTNCANFIALRQRQLLLPLWLLSWNTLTGDTRDTNGRFFRGALLMDNLLGLADQVWLAGSG